MLDVLFLVALRVAARVRLEVGSTDLTALTAFVVLVAESLLFFPAKVLLLVEFIIGIRTNGSIDGSLKHLRIANPSLAQWYCLNCAGDILYVGVLLQTFGCVVFEYPLS